MAEVQSALQSLVRKFVWRTVLEPGTALFHDLSIAGDDAWELLEAVHQQSGTAFGDMCFSDYFPNEAAALGFCFFPWRRRSKRRLTIAHLERVIQRGVWFEPS